MCVGIIVQDICLYTHTAYPGKKQLKPGHIVAAGPLETLQLFCKCVSYLPFCISAVLEICAMQIVKESWETLI